MEEPFQKVKGKQRRKRRPSVASLEDQVVESGPSQESPSAPKKVKKAPGPSGQPQSVCARAN
jgi:hypothetical protein